MAPPPSLTGPPNLNSPTPPPQDVTRPTLTTDPPMGLTENSSATFLTSGNPCLDLFFHVVPGTPSQWRGTGKSDKERFYTAALWLHNYHPKTLACNLASIAEFGYFKDLPEILYRLIEGHDVRANQKAEWDRKTVGRRLRKLVKHRGIRGRGRLRRVPKPKSKPVSAVHRNVPREVRVKREMERAKLEKENASKVRKEKKIAAARKAYFRYQRDPDYRFLHDQVSDLFAQCLKSDINNLKTKQLKKMSLAAKWCPSLDSSFDKATLLCENIARRVFPRESHPEYKGIEDSHYSYRVRDRLRKEVLVPLRKVLELPEVYMGANDWGALPYNRVASVAMKLYKGKFVKHDKERFCQYLEDVRQGKDTIAAGALLPHEIIKCLEDDDDGGLVSELQWNRMLDDLSKLGKLTNCLAVCDVSGSMTGTPMEVCVALGLLVSELCEEPWKGKVITFSHNPQLHLIRGDSLKSKSESVKKIDWGMNTDFQKVFDLLLQVAVNGQLKPEQMIKKVFVFSDMEFDQASGHNRSCYYIRNQNESQNNSSWETDYEVIQRKFRERGYGDVVPQIVFWNLRHSESTPVTGTQKGVALLSGFSKNLLKLFLGKDGVTRPDQTMEEAISGKEYQNLVVVD
ncbi:hypothetical protein M0R45_023495 [Rubus argutus]|uniref:Uncharacterized protein n=1 Tax=Rubus argutus TaxID=59490 RepID=A0AAW1WQE9_RUBAR